MRQFIRKNGQINTVVIFSLFAVALSILATVFVAAIFERQNVEIKYQAGIWISILVTLFIAPAMSWVMVGLFLKVDQLETEMRCLATYDNLTGLLTRWKFIEQATYFHKVALREGLPYALIIADLDNFKEINDQFGHLTGDRALATFGEAILHNLRKSDLACRFGGDEFLFFLPNSTKDQAQRFGERLNEIIAGTIDCSWLKIDLSISLGIASFPDTPAESLEDMISAADQALYGAKSIGGNRIQHYKLESTP